MHHLEERQLKTAKVLNWITGVGTVVALIGLIYLYGSLRAAKAAADAATRAANLSQLEQRPYMVAEAPRFVSPPTVGQNASATDFVRNVGKTPAVRVFINAEFRRYVDSSKSRPALFTFLDSAFADIRIRNMDSKQEQDVGRDVAPGTPSFFRTDEDPTPMSQTDISQMTSGELVLFYIGLASYSDSSGADYRTEYCFYFIGPDPKVWHICDSHNTIK